AIAQVGQSSEVIQKGPPVVWVQQGGDELSVFRVPHTGVAERSPDVTIEENDLPLPDINDVNQAGYGFNDSLYERLTITPTYHLSEIKDALGGPVRRALEFPAQPESNRLSSLAQEGRNYPHAGTSLTRKTSGREARG